jgi:cobalt-zinc-cadmium efflux system protein
LTAGAAASLLEQFMDNGHAHAHAHTANTLQEAGPGGMNRAFLAGILLNAGFLLVEVFYGLRSHSLSLLADAAHNFGDVLSLGLAWLALWLAGRQATVRRTYGFRRAGILAALVNGVLLLAATGAILWEALGRLWHPQPVQGVTMIVVAALGTGINLGSALFFMRGSHGDLNVRAAFLHLLADAGVSLGVVAAGVGILLTNWAWLDPAISLLVGGIVLYGAWPLFRSALDLALDSVPDNVDPLAVRQFLLQSEGVRDLHHMHIWALSTTSTALSVHLVVDPDSDVFKLVRDLANEVEHDFRIDHATLQVEASGDSDPCPLQSAASSPLNPRR